MNIMKYALGAYRFNIDGAYAPLSITLKISKYNVSYFLIIYMRFNAIPVAFLSKLSSVIKSIFNKLNIFLYFNHINVLCKRHFCLILNKIFQKMILNQVL